MPLIASFIVAFSIMIGVGQEEVNGELKRASLNGHVDWDNSIYVIATNCQVSIGFIPV